MTVRTPSKPDSLSALTFALITSFLPGTSASHADLSQLQAWALRELRNDAQGSTRREWEDVRRTLEGLRRKAGFKVQDALEGGLGKVLRVLESQRGGGGREWDEGLPITVSWSMLHLGIDTELTYEVSNLAQHVQLLVYHSSAALPCSTLTLPAEPLHTSHGSNSRLGRIIPHPTTSFRSDSRPDPLRRNHVYPFPGGTLGRELRRRGPFWLVRI